MADQARRRGGSVIEIIGVESMGCIDPNSVDTERTGIQVPMRQHDLLTEFAIPAPRRAVIQR